MKNVLHLAKKMFIIVSLFSIVYYFFYLTFLLVMSELLNVCLNKLVMKTLDPHLASVLNQT